MILVKYIHTNAQFRRPGYFFHYYCSQSFAAASNFALSFSKKLKLPPTVGFFHRKVAHRDSRSFFYTTKYTHLKIMCQYNHQYNMLCEVKWAADRNVCMKARPGKSTSPLWRCDKIT